MSHQRKESPNFNTSNIDFQNSPPNQESIYQNLQQEPFTLSYLDASILEELKGCSQDAQFLLTGEEIIYNYAFPINFSIENRPPITDCTLQVTNYRLIIDSKFPYKQSKWYKDSWNNDQIKSCAIPWSIPFGYIKEIDKDMRIVLKTGLKYQLRSFGDAATMHQTILQGIIRFPFCNQFTLDKENSQVYDCLAQMERMRIEEDKHVAVDNQKGKLCSTYPKYFVSTFYDNQTVCKFNQKFFQEVLITRIGSRIPALTYYFQEAGSSLWRSSKLKVGFQHNKYNKMYLDQISKRLNVVDVNELNFNKDFPKLQTLASLRRVYQNLMVGYLQCKTNVTLLKLISKWFQDVDKIISISYNCAEKLKKGEIVLVQEQTGLDRVAQISALVQIILDPFYRTFHGLGLLIEKQFVSFGHPFHIRLGFQRQKIDETSPIFIQFLECVHQMTCAHPQSFEYSGAYLAKIAYEAFTAKYNNFVFNTSQQRSSSKMVPITYNIWKNLSMLKEYYNYQWKEEIALKELISLRKKPSIKEYHIWKEYFDICTNMQAEYCNGPSNNIFIKKEIFKNLQKTKSL